MYDGRSQHIEGVNSSERRIKKRGIPIGAFAHEQQRTAEPYLEQLDSYYRKHELKEAGDQHYVANGLYSNYHALDYMLKTNIFKN